MKKLSAVIILSLVVFFSCMVASEVSIVGTWQATHALGLPVSGGYYYQFKSDGTYSRDSSKTRLFGTSADMTGTYTLSANGDLKITPTASLSITDTSYSFTAYIMGTTMYWYLNGVESVRLSLQ